MRSCNGQQTRLFLRQYDFTSRGGRNAERSRLLRRHQCLRSPAAAFAPAGTRALISAILRFSAACRRSGSAACGFGNRAARSGGASA
jgi:hypothetical protein